MKRQNREINIFSMSALDLFASAMGAFILITLILMPYYLKKTPAEPVQETQQSCPEPILPACPVCPTPPSPEPTITCPPPQPPVKEVVDNLLIMQMEWSREADVDLHVLTPDGLYKYDQRTIPGKPGKLTLDNTKGGEKSLEIWMAYNPTPGNYEICYHLYSGSPPVAVKGRLDKPHGPAILPVQTLRQTKQKLCPLKFRIGTDYTYHEISRG